MNKPQTAIQKMQTQTCTFCRWKSGTSSRCPKGHASSGGGSSAMSRPKSFGKKSGSSSSFHR